MSVQTKIAPETAKTTNKKVLVYNYKSNAWATFSYPTDAPAFLGRFFAASGEELLYGSFYDRHLYQLDSGATDFGSPVVARGRTKAFGAVRGSASPLLPAQQGKGKGVRRVSVLCSAATGSLTLRVFNGQNADPVAERAGLSLSGAGWKRYALSTMQEVGPLVQVEVEYSGPDELELEGILVEGNALGREPRPL